MPEVKIVEDRPESAEEKAMREWFAEQALASPDTLDAAARLLIGLITGLVGVLFGVLTVTAEAGKMPAYMALPSVRWLGVISVAALLAALLSALNVVLPRKKSYAPARLDQQEDAFTELLKIKSRWLRAATVAFGVGVFALGIVLVVALLFGA
jgi:hypothetical protein